jgi:hypothetical protein
VTAAAPVVRASALTAGSTAGAAATAVPLRFADDFSGPAGSAPRQWAALAGWIETGNGPLSRSLAGWHLDGHGHLAISTFRQPDGSWRGTIIDTPWPQFAYGVVSFRVLVPGGVSGIWPAVWAVAGGPEQERFPPAAQGGEIDFMEVFGARSDHTNLMVHWMRPDHRIAMCGGTVGPPITVPPGQVTPGATAGWHVVSVYWLPGELTWFFDGVPYLALSRADCPAGAWVFDKPHRLRLMMLAGGTAGRPAPGGPGRYTMLVDYLRVEAPPALTAVRGLPAYRRG